MLQTEVLFAAASISLTFNFVLLWWVLKLRRRCEDLRLGSATQGPAKVTDFVRMGYMFVAKESVGMMSQGCAEYGGSRKACPIRFPGREALWCRACRRLFTDPDGDEAS